jgi:uncharacterized protein (DUF1684 family)
MSHFTRVKTEIRDPVTLIRALKTMGYTVPNGEVITASSGRSTVPVQVTAVKGEIRIRFAKSGSVDGTYEMGADWGKDKQRLVGEILQAYAQEKVLTMAREKGYMVLRNRTVTDGRVEILLRKAS